MFEVRNENKISSNFKLLTSNFLKKWHRLL